MQLIITIDLDEQEFTEEAGVSEDACTKLRHVCDYFEDTAVYPHEREVIHDADGRRLASIKVTRGKTQSS